MDATPLSLLWKGFIVAHHESWILRHYGSSGSPLTRPRLSEAAVITPGYETVFAEWDDPRWVLVTHENGRPLALRERGPLRLVERDSGDRDSDNLCHFNDWIRMIGALRWSLESIALEGLSEVVLAESDEFHPARHVIDL